MAEIMQMEKQYSEKIVGYEKKIEAQQSELQFKVRSDLAVCTQNISLFVIIFPFFRVWKCYRKKLRGNRSTKVL